MADAPSPRGVTSGSYTALSIILAASGISYIALPQVCWSNSAVCRSVRRLQLSWLPQDLPGHSAVLVHGRPLHNMPAAPPGPSCPLQLA